MKEATIDTNFQKQRQAVKIIIFRYNVSILAQLGHE